jgi:putative ABC transport system ATP-binding protein
MEEILIQTESLTRSYLSEDLETTAVRNASLRISQGEFVAVMGPSGCGKTTLLNMLGLIDRPSSGAYSFQGTKVNGLSENQLTRMRRGHMGFIFQNYNLVEELNVQENVELPLIFMGVNRKERRRRSSEILDSLKLGHRSSHYPTQLSGGQQQRVAFARAIINQPQLILADEPTGNLDSRNSVMMMDLLTEHNRQGGTIIMVTHSQKDASYAHRIIKLLDGEIIN